MNHKVTNSDPVVQRESFTELIGQLANRSTAVVHDEIELLIQQTREKARAMRSGVLTIAIGAFFSFVAFISLGAALIIELSSYMAPVIAALVTGAAFALSGFIIVVIGYLQLQKSSPKNIADNANAQKGG